MTYQDSVQEVRCPKCHGHTWDNRTTKRNPKAPDYKCKDKGCDGAIWLDSKKNGAQPYAESAPAPVKPVATSGKAPYESGPRIQGLDPEVSPVPALDALFNVYDACMDHVLAVNVPKLERAKIGASPEAVSAMTSTLLIQATKR